MDRKAKIDPTVSRDLASFTFASFRTQSYRKQTTSGGYTKRICWNNAGSRLACFQPYNHIQIWQAEKPVSAITFKNSQERSLIEDIWWNPLHSDQLATITDDGYLRIWDVKTQKSVHQVFVQIERENKEPRPGRLKIVRYSPDGKYIALGLRSDHICIVNTHDMSVKTVYRENEEIFDMCWSNGSDILAVALASAYIRLLSVETEAISDGDEEGMSYIKSVVPCHTLRGHRTGVSCLDFDPRGKYLVAGSNEGIVSIWDTSDWICIKTLTSVDQAISDVSFSHDGQYIAVAYDSDTPISIYHIESAEVVYSIPKQNMAYRSNICWNPFRYMLAYTGESYGVTVFSK